MLVLLFAFLTQAHINAKKIRQDMYDLLSMQQLAVVNYIAIDIDSNVKYRIDLLKRNAVILGKEKYYAKPKEAEAFLAGRSELQTAFVGDLILIDPAGRMIADYPEMPERQAMDFAGREYFDEALRGSEVVVGKPRIGGLSGRLGVPIATQVRDDGGAVRAVLVGVALLTDPTLFGQLESARLGKGGYIAISVPRHRLIAISSDYSRILTPMPPPGVNVMLDRFVAGYEGSGIAVNARGVEILTSGMRIPSIGWIVQIALPTEEAFAPVRQMILWSYEVAVALSLAAALLAWILLEYVLRPLRGAADQMERMARDRLRLHEIPVSSGDEIGTLLQSFNRLVSERNVAEQAVEASERFALATIDTVPEQICVLSMTGEVVMVNKAWCDFHDRHHSETSSVNYWIGANYLEICNSSIGPGGEEARAMADGIAKVMNGEIERFRMKYHCTGSAAGQVFMAYVSRFSDSDHVFITHADITGQEAARLRLEVLAQTDTLTGLANRGHFMSLAEKEWTRAVRYESSLSLLMFDIDHFKVINDSYGHHTGDVVLGELGRICRETLREIDIIGRMGGEEFAVVLPMTAHRQAVEVAERLRATIAATAVRLDDGTALHFSVSIGVASLLDKETGVEQLLSQADKALYAAKNGGRNRVVAHAAE